MKQHCQTMGGFIRLQILQLLLKYLIEFREKNGYQYHWIDSRVIRLDLFTSYIQLSPYSTCHQI